MTEDEFMRTQRCPYRTVEDLHRRRRQARGLAGCGYAAIERPDDAQVIEKWNRLYAEAHGLEAPPKQRKPKPAPPPSPPPPKKTKPKAPPPKEEPQEYRILDHLDELFPDE